MRRLILVLTVPIFLSACGSPEGETVGFSVDHAYCPAGRSVIDSLPEVLRVETYRVVISGDGIDPPIEYTFAGNTISAPIEGIPKGEDRTILVEALNSTGQVICRRRLEGVKIEGGKMISLSIPLLSVPFVTNLSDGNVITQTRLFFRGYGEPAGAIEILDNFNGAETPLVDLNTVSDLISPSISDAGFSFLPAVLPTGTHTFTIRDAGTGESSEVTVTLIGPGRTPGMGINTAGAFHLTETDAVGSGGLFAEVLNSMSQ